MPVILRFLNVQGAAGLAASIALALLLVLEKGETRHWKKQSGAFEQLYLREQAAMAGTVANYRTAAEAARAADAANLERVQQQQRAINERTAYAFEARLAAARAVAQRLRGASAAAAADPGAGGAASMPRLPASPGGAAQAAGENGLPATDQLIATEQAIQLDELVKWVRAQAAVDRQGSR